LANFYGEQQKVKAFQALVAAFVERALKRQPIHIWGDGSIVRDYLFLTDVANACAYALRSNGLEEIFNIGSGAGVSLTTLIELLDGIFGRHLGVVHCDGRAFDVYSNVLCINRAREELRWHPEINMYEGLPKTLQWLERQQSSARMRDRLDNCLVDRIAIQRFFRGSFAKEVVTLQWLEYCDQFLGSEP
jgi:UDP-glucose 4-epimerase